MSSTGRRIAKTVAGGAAWLVAAFWVVPPLIEAAHRSAIVPAMSSRPIDFFLAQWYDIALILPFAAAAVALFAWLLRSPTWSRRLVPDARPSDIGAIRILVCGVLLISTVWENLASTAALPRSLVDPPGLMQLFYALPIGFEQLAASPAALGIFEWVTAAILFCGLIGFRTRLTLPLGALLYLVLGGLLRQYAWFYHTGLLALYLLIVLSFLPAQHGWSVDRRLRHRRRRDVVADVPSRRYGWARYAVWTAFALPYVAAGLSKLRNGGLDWWEASNFKFILFHSTLRPMQFDYDWSLRIASAPDMVFELLAVSAVLGELMYGLVLFSRRARWIMPSVMLLMHGGILFLQNILFFDLILLQAIYFNFRPAIESVSRRSRRVAEWWSRFTAGAKGPSGASARTVTPGRRLVIAITSILTVCWVFRVEYYPFTGMQMFSTKRAEPVVYERALAHTRSGEVMRAPIEESIPAMADSRFRRVLGMSFEPERSVMARTFMDAVVERWNAAVPPERQIQRVEIQRWEWNYLSDPDSPTYGRLIDRVTYTFDDGAVDVLE